MSSFSDLYAIDDEHGNQLCAGLSEHEVASWAQHLANKRGKSVWFYRMHDGDNVQVNPSGDET